MELFVFSSVNLTNIWAGVGAGIWAVSLSDNQTTMKGRATKSEKMIVGSAGIIWCSETHALTTPFLVRSMARTSETVSNVWPETWAMPFEITPLGTPHRQMPGDEAMRDLDFLVNSGSANISQALGTAGGTVFTARSISTKDWSVLLTTLAS